MIAYDLFCGAGGASLGLHRAGLRVVGFDKDRDSCATHHRAGHATVRADLSVWSWAHVGTPLVLWGSPPCQPFSASGDGKGGDDERDGMPWFLEAVRTLLPPIVFMENVEGLTFDKHAAYFGGFLHELRRLGYEAQWKVLNTADYGVPQCRYRLIVVARRDGHRIVWPTVTHTEGGGLFTAPWLSMAEALGWGESWSLEYVRGQGMIERHGERAPTQATEPAPTIRAGGRLSHWKVHTNVDQRDGKRQTRDIEMPATTVSSKSGGQWKLRPGKYASEDHPTGNRRLYELDEPAPVIAFGHDVSSWMWERPTTTINGEVRVSAPGRHDPEVAGSQQADAIRVELHELARLQDFPDGYPFKGNRTSIARQIGNACPATLVEVVARANLPVGKERAA